MSIPSLPRLLSLVQPSILAFVSLAFAGVAAEATLAATPLTEFEDSPKVVIDEAWQIINREYVDDSFNQVDWQALRQDLLGREYTSQEAAYGALRAALQQLNDPYTRFLSPTEYADLTEQTSGEASGIGVRLERNSQTGAVAVTSVAPGSPAELSGIVVGDRILLVDGQSTERLTAEGVLQQLRGSEGSQVTLTVSRDGGAPRTVIMTRARMDLPTVEYSQKTVGGRPIGYIRLIEFNANAPAQMADAIGSLTEAGVEGFVLDLRGNLGGLLMASVDISRMWLQHGQIVRTLDRLGNDEAISANRTALTDLPLTVLVDSRSASSSEILTGALRDNDRAKVVGNTTYGKALVQSLHGLTDGSGLTVTVAHYYTPDGIDISSRGITPDVEVGLSDRQRRELFSNPALLGTDADAQYLRAAEVLEQTILASQMRPTTGASRLGLINPVE
ncbi:MULTISPECIES: S41 family peptidase [Cyanophyceae]|uniref:S41 family peptidase n=1 Tax=Cyanophyceae TaxID=3028117 RepID=UPI0016887ECC|nr:MULTISPECIES: S41 family peptidase [Cyanophyceae]MBD1917457.1 S41 family peptidase [Phormidium sp. FACHB-77]MBD2029668.1 S41 family peptidase [Phormidium sp. FACHB-322]MBD2050929.1 S41 family peptidase [Leptolyngbya sp. FACHB-60]